MMQSKVGRDHHEGIGCAVVVQTQDGKILLGKRKNSYKSGLYGLPGGRINGNEKAVVAAQRELLEETGLKSKSLEYIGVVKEWQNSYNFIHFIYLCTQWEGAVQLMEPEKCEGWEWFDFTDLPNQILSGHLQGIELLQNKDGMRDI